MSNARWCDIGEHAFPEGQAGSSTLKFTRQVKNQWGGYQPVDDVREACASCARDTGLRDAEPQELSQAQLDERADEQRARSGGRILNRVKAIANGKTTSVDAAEARERGYDPGYVAWLEEQEKKPLDPSDDFDERVASATRHPSGGLGPRPVD